MQRLRGVAVSLALLLFVSACGGGKNIGSDGLAPSSTAASETTSDQCKTTTLTGSEVGVSPTTITVSVIADTGSSLRPGLFQGSVDAVKAWADYMNANGGLACRQVVVKTLDSKLSGDDAKNTLTTACGNSLALVGTTALFLDDMRAAEQCKDKAGKPTGMLDMAVLQTYSQQQCSSVSFAVLPLGGSCPYRGSGVRGYRQGKVAANYYFKKYGKNTLHGVFLVPSDLPSTISASTPYIAALEMLGIRNDAEFGASAGDTQLNYSQYAQAIKSNKSTFARDGSDYVSNVFLRKEAQVQGVNTVKVWDCSLQCYDQRLITTGGAAMEGHYTWLSFLPFEDKGHNAELDNFLRYDTKPDAFGAQAWVAGQAFAAAVNAVVAKSGPNGLTRAAILAAIRGLTQFDDNGFFAPTNIGGKIASTCFVGMQVQNGHFVRVDPTTPGTFDCAGGVVKFRLDPVKAYSG